MVTWDTIVDPRSFSQLRHLKFFFCNCFFALRRFFVGDDEPTEPFPPLPDEEILDVPLIS